MSDEFSISRRGLVAALGFGGGAAALTRAVWGEEPRMPRGAASVPAGEGESLSGVAAQADGPAWPRLPIVSELPDPTEVYHGRLVLLSGEVSDRLYACRKEAGRLRWVRVGA